MLKNGAFSLRLFLIISLSSDFAYGAAAAAAGASSPAADGARSAFRSFATVPLTPQRLPVAADDGATVEEFLLSEGRVSNCCARPRLPSQSSSASSTESSAPSCGYYGDAELSSPMKGGDSLGFGVEVLSCVAEFSPEAKRQISCALKEHAQQKAFIDAEGLLAYYQNNPTKFTPEAVIAFIKKTIVLADFWDGIRLNAFVVLCDAVSFTDEQAADMITTLEAELPDAELLRKFFRLP